MWRNREFHINPNCSEKQFSSNKKAGLTIWTLLVSLCLHAVLLAALAFLKVSDYRGPTEISKTKLHAELQVVKKIIDTPRILPVPGIKKADFAERVQIPVIQGIGWNEKKEPKIKKNSDSIKSLAARISAMPPMTAEQPKIEFFGSKTQVKTICYVVDCSGSMQGIFSQVTQNLKKSISSLEPDQFFYIIFFGGGRLYEFGEPAMRRAFPASITEADNFIDSITPAGQTNAKIAIERAFHVKDSLGNSPDTVFLLTDGLDLTENTGTYYFSKDIQRKRKKFSPQTRINTIGFWTKPTDCVILRDIAEDSRGSFTLIAKPKTERYINIE